MNERDFENFLNKASTTPAATATRLKWAKKAEELLGMSLDTVVSDDDTMFEALHKLRENEDPKHNRIQNAVRKYYQFRNGKEFPKLRYYHSPKHP